VGVLRNTSAGIPVDPVGDFIEDRSGGRNSAEAQGAGGLGSPGGQAAAQRTQLRAENTGICVGEGGKSRIWIPVDILLLAADPRPLRGAEEEQFVFLDGAA